MTEYVAGFMFEENAVALIRKNRPSWQKGLLNGIGGHVEYNELPESAMARELYEETGYNTQIDDWAKFCVLTGPDYKVHFYFTFGEVYKLETKTDEKIEVINCLDLGFNNCIPNLEWLIPMAKERFGKPGYYSVDDNITKIVWKIPVDHREDDEY